MEPPHSKWQTYTYTDDNGHVRKVSFKDLDNTKFFMILEKESYESVSLEAPPFAYDVKLKPAPGAEVAKRVLNSIEDKEDTGSVRVTSNPSGAKVYLNAELVGNTPYTLEQKAGKYQIKIQHPNFVTLEEQLTIDTKKSRAIHFDLEGLDKNRQPAASGKE